MASKSKRPKRVMSVEEAEAARVMSVEKAEAALLASRKAAAREALMKELAVSVPTAAVLLGLSRQHAYNCIREDTFPVPTLKVGNTIRVPTRALREMLQVPGSSSETAAA
jgi:predicted DNA-binding transcriptional regulator AlpA